MSKPDPARFVSSPATRAAIFLRFWKPKNEWHFTPPATPPEAIHETPPAELGGHAAEAVAGDRAYPAVADAVKAPARSLATDAPRARG